VLDVLMAALVIAAVYTARTARGADATERTPPAPDGGRTPDGNADTREGGVSERD
jgi:hypothetical protein